MNSATKPMAEIGRDINKAVEWLLQGELVAIPTETVYGLAGNALDSRSISKIFEVKNRPAFDPLIMHVADIERAKDHVETFPEKALVLAEHFWPGPITILLPKKSHVPDLLTSGLETVAVRVPHHPMTLDLLRSLPFPLAAPSANPFGYISPTKALHVEDQLGEKIPYILDGGDCRVGVESTIIGFEAGEAVIYRLGGVELEKIEKLIGPVKTKSHSSSNPQAPGMLESHYAPRKKVYYGNPERLAAGLDLDKAAVLSYKGLLGMELPPSRHFCLSAQGDLHEAASRLFEGLRYLDKSDASYIIAEPVPDIGLGKAINDRLKRASA